MPTPAASNREDQVVKLVVADLVRSGHVASIVSWPDREQPPRADGLTVDAELSVDDQRWALDVMSLRWRSELEGATEKVTKRLEKKFGAQLRADGKTLVVTCHVGTDQDTLQSIIEMAGAAITSGVNAEQGDESAALYPWSPALGAVHVQPWLGQSVNLREEIVLSSGGSLRGKLTRQFPRARQRGYRTCLAIDQRGAAGKEGTSNFMAAPGTILGALEDMETEAGVAVDLAVLISGDDSVLWLRGASG